MWVEDDGTPIEDPMLRAALDVLNEREHARDLEEAGRVAGLDLRAHDAGGEPPDIDHEPSTETMIGNVLDAVMTAVRELVIPVVRELRELSERVDNVESAVFGEGGFLDADPPVDTLDIGDLPDRPLTPAEDRARAQRIADKARAEAAAMRAEDLRGIDQDAPDAPAPPVADEVVIPAQGPKGGFRG